MSEADAYMLCSVAADVDITELVDGNVGVHCLPEIHFCSEINVSVLAKLFAMKIYYWYL
jgi:acetamidase/formamidase